MADNKGDWKIRTRKFLVNKLLFRKQMVVDVIHPGAANVSRKDIQGRIATMYKVADEKQVIVYGLSTAFGGGKSTGFALIYDNLKSLNEFEPRYRLIRQGLTKKIESTRKQRKERKNRASKVHGKIKAIVRSGGAAPVKEKKSGK